MSEQMTTNANGGKQHRVEHRCEALFPRAILEVARLRCEGFEKHGYEDDNYFRIEPKEHIGRALRHILMWMIGDREDGNPREHLVHACCRVMMALEILIMKEELYNELDDAECEYLMKTYGYDKGANDMKFPSEEARAALADIERTHPKRIRLFGKWKRK